VIRGCTLAKANLTRATGVLFDPQHNKVKGARISLEAALAIVGLTGMVVEAFEPA
jgi:fluoroquinolone resistance protein